MTSKMLIGCEAMAIFLFCASTCVAQPNEVEEEIHIGSVRRRSTSIADVYATLQHPIETKDFQEKQDIGIFVKKFEKAISKKGKDVQIVIDHEAFMGDKGQRLFVLGSQVELPPVPTKMTANMALRLVVSQVGEVEATYLLRSGQILITSDKRARSSYFVKNAEVIVDLKNRPITDALDALAEQSGVSIIVDGRVSKKARAEVTARFAGKLDTAVRLLTDSVVGLKHVVVDNVVYVTSPTNADGFEKKTAPLGDVRFSAYKNRPLLDAIGDMTGWVLDSRVKQKANVRVTARWLNHVDGDTAVRLLTDMAGLRHVVVDGVVYITDAANAKKLMEEESRKKPGK